jgi:serine protease Do
MKVLKIGAIVASLAGAVVLALALAPSVHGQTRGRELTVLGGRGGELGVRIADAESGGVQVEEVQPNGAAEKAGLKRGDVIVEFDGERVRSGRQFARLVQETAPGKTVKATIVRDGKRQDVQVTPSEGRESSVIIDGDRLRGRFGDRFDYLDRMGADLGRLRDLPFDFNFDFDFPGMTSAGRLGVTVDPLTHQLAEYFGAKDGVLVTAVTDGSAAAKAGIKAGDVITSINGERVTSRADLMGALRRADNEDVTVGIVRDKKETSVKAKIEAPRRTLRGARPA